MNRTIADLLSIFLEEINKSKGLKKYKKKKQKEILMQPLLLQACK